MKFKEVEIIKNRTLFSGFRFIAVYHDYFSEQEDMIEKFTSCMPRKGDVIRVKDKNTDKYVFLSVKHIYIDYIENKMTIWCK